MGKPDAANRVGMSARPAPVTAQGAPILHAPRRRGAPAPRVEAAASFPGPGSRFGLPPARRIARWTSTTKLVGHPRAAPIRRSVICPATTIADLAGADTKVVFVARH